jgi:hypothetical protein
MHCPVAAAAAAAQAQTRQRTMCGAHLEHLLLLLLLQPLQVLLLYEPQPHRSCAQCRSDPYQ